MPDYLLKSGDKGKWKIQNTRAHRAPEYGAEFSWTDERTHDIESHTVNKQIVRLTKYAFISISQTLSNIMSACVFVIADRPTSACWVSQ
jgi:hypothetical protein